MLDYAHFCKPLLDRLSTYKHAVDRTISPNDSMFVGDEDHYFSVAYSGAATIALAMSIVGRSEVGRVLDLPCGHGRVLRGLRAFFPEAEIVASDIDQDGVDFCAATFGAQPVYSDIEPGSIPLEGRFDLIWVGSLFTHLDAPLIRSFLDVFDGHLADDGLLVFTTEGRRAYAQLTETRQLAHPDRIVRDWPTGFAYSDYRGRTRY